jgi:thiol-disulfide isomerase/thioredoxin
MTLNMRVTILIFILLSLFAFGSVISARRHKFKQVISSSNLLLNSKHSLGEKATVVIFTSTVCSKCQITKSIVNEAVEDLIGVKSQEIDVASNLALIKSARIYSTPTILVLDSNGFEVARSTGVVDRDELVKELKNLVLAS